MRSLPIRPQPGAPTSIASAAGLTLVFVVGLVVCTAAVRGVLLRDPEVESDQTRRSLLLYRHFGPHKDEYDAVFVGSSRFYRGVDPEVFDAEVGRAGLEMRSFNFSMNGMRMPEIIARVDWMLAQKPAKLRWLIVELTTLDPAFREDNRGGQRMIAWHTPRATLDCLSVIGASTRTTAEKLAAARPHLVEFGYRFGNIGLGFEASSRWLGVAPVGPRLKHFDGYESEEEESQRKRGRRKRAGLDEQGEEEDERDDDEVREPADVAAPTFSVAGADDLPPAQERVLAAFVERVEAAGVELIVLRMPRTPRDLTARAARKRGLVPTLLAYDTRAAAPALWAAELYRDASHLNSRGAAAFSKRLAADFVTHVRAGE